MKRFLFLGVVAVLSTALQAASGYHLLKRISIPGDGGWDFVTVDSVNRRVYVSHGTQVEVLDADSGEIVGKILAPLVDAAGRPIAGNVHGAAVAPDLGRGFTTNGRAASMTIFDLETLQVIGEARVAEGPDVFLYDPFTKRAFSFSRRARNASAVDGADGKMAGMVDLGGVPEAAASDGKGHIYVDIQDQDRIATFDARTLTVGATWPVGTSCHEPTSMAIDRENGRLFVGCRGKQFIAMDIETGRVVAKLPIGAGTDAAEFDPATRLVFVANGEGSVTVIRQESPDTYSVVENVKTEEGAKTMGLDPKTQGSSSRRPTARRRQHRLRGDNRRPARSCPARSGSSCSEWSRSRSRALSGLVAQLLVRHQQERRMGEMPDFSGVSEEYAATRPLYPPELFEWLASSVNSRDTAWDTATGSGQAALGLATHFTRVIATDLSSSQLQHARQHPRIEYRVARAEESGLAADSVDLVVAAAAVHWFDLERFYMEVGRVTRRGGVLAAWTYHVAHVRPPLDRVLWPFYRDVVGRHFAAGARMVDSRYEGLTLPGTDLPAPVFTVSVRWSADEVLRFVRTWSGVQSYMAATKQDPVAQIAHAVRDIFGGDNAVMEVSWPLYIRAARQ